MSRATPNDAIGSRSKRNSLPAGAYWYSVDSGRGSEIHLGYRKGKRGGTWLVRWRNASGYKQLRLGPADDVSDEGTLDFEGAKKLAAETARAQRRAARAEAEGPLPTVRLAVESYTKLRDERDSDLKHRTVRSDASSRLGRYVVGLPARGKRKAVNPVSLADVALTDLNARHLLDWKDGLPTRLKRTTKQRLVNDLKAALNAAVDKHHDRLPPDVGQTIRRGLEIKSVAADELDDVARSNQILTAGQIASVIAAARIIDREQAWGGDLFRLIVVLAATGARFSQVARMRVADVQTGRLIVPASRKGKGKKVPSSAVGVHPEIIEALLPATTGRHVNAPLLERDRRRRVEGSIQWERAGRGPWTSASELNRPWSQIRVRAGLPAGVVAYALRHSSIVRRIEANVPIRIVAALHDTSVAMIERHYSRWIVDGIDELGARGVVPLIPLEQSNVIELARA